MRLYGVRPTLLAIGMVGVANCCSCSHHGSNSQHGATQHAKPSPEETFNVIADVFRRRIEETPVGFVVSDSTGRSSMRGTNKVTSELIRPATESEPYKAIITVVSESHYSILRTKEAPEDKAHDENADANKEKSLSETDGDKGVESFDPVLTSKPAPSDTPKGRVTVDVIKPPPLPKDDVRKYELVYKNGRWTLVTKLDKKTEQSIQNAFQSALDTQG